MLRKVFWGVMILFGVCLAYYCYAWLLTPPFSMTTVVEIDAPVDKTFEIFNDPTHMKTWMKTDQMQFKNIELTSGTHQETGATYRVVMLENNRELEMTETLTAFEPNQRVAFTLKDEFADFNLDISFEEKEGKTIVTEVNTQGKELPSWSKVMVFTFSGLIEEEKQLMYNNLKELVEKN